MSDTIETPPRPLGQRTREAYDAARARPGAPWGLLDNMFQQVRVDLGRINSQICATLNAISETTAETMRETTLQRAEAEFCRWRDMPDMEMHHAVYVLQNPPAAPENLEVSARNLVDNLRALGVRIELANKNSLRISPARLVTGRDKETIKRLKTHIIAEITSRSDVWHLE